MNITKLESFKDWLLSRNTRLSNCKPANETELDIKILLEQTNRLKPKNKNNVKKRFQTSTY
jgi:hypothetical protein